MKTVSIKWVLPLIFFVLLSPLFFGKKEAEKSVHRIQRGDLEVDVKSVGVLEAHRSLSIASEVKGELAKILFLAPDGVNAESGDLLIRIDSSSFEGKVEELQNKIHEQKLYLDQLHAAHEWERTIGEAEEKALECEYAIALVDHDRAINIEAHQEREKLKTAMEKARVKYLEIASFEEELNRLEKEGYLNPGEKKQAVKKLEEEKENFEEAERLYLAFERDTLPLLQKKSALALQKASMRLQEGRASTKRRVAKALEQYESARLGLDLLNAQLAEAKLELEKTEIKAPGRGMVVLREEFRQGERRRARVGDVAIKNQPLIDLPDLTRMVVKTKVREIDLHKIIKNLPVTVEIDAYPFETFTGEVQSIGILALQQQKRDEEKCFEVRILLDPAEKELRPGMTAHATIHTAKIKDALLIPVFALFYKNGKPACYVGREERLLEIGLHNEEWAEVKSGLKEGDEVLLTIPL